ncbi:MAG: hypothetical protein WAK48_24540 [Candidatus Acidiferrum sp.]
MGAEIQNTWRGCALLFEDGSAEKEAFVREAKKHLGITPAFAKKGEYAAFQAADLFAFEYLLSNRAIVATGEDMLSFSDLQKPLQALLASQPRSAEPQWGVHDKDVIERAWVADELDHKKPTET